MRAGPARVRWAPSNGLSNKLAQSKQVTFLIAHSFTVPSNLSKKLIYYNSK